jgi:hypothetical protein
VTIFYHYNDPAAPKDAHRWPFVYLHGAAESHNEKKAEVNGWEWVAPDLFVSDQPMPTETGDYAAVLYGMRVVAVIRVTWLGPQMCGRVACPNDQRGYEHAKSSERWM